MKKKVKIQLFEKAKTKYCFNQVRICPRFLKNLLIIVLIIPYSLAAQNSFQEFLSYFPERSWDEFPSDIRLLPKSKSIDIDKANLNMWGKHASIKRITSEYSYAIPAPHYILLDGNYTKGSEGLFVKVNKNRDGNIVKSSFFPLARVKINDQIILLIIYYNFWNAENENWSEFYEAYTYRLTDEQLLSALCLWTNKKYSISFIKKNIIELYEELFYSEKIGDDFEEKSSIFKISYIIREDGYFKEIIRENAEKDGLVFSAKAWTDKGWINVFEYPEKTSSVVNKIKDEGVVVLEKTKDPAWYKVISHTNDQNIEFHGGFVMSDRILTNF